MGRTMKDLRNAAGITQQRAAADLGITKQFLYQIERPWDPDPLPPQHARRLAEIYRCSIKSIIETQVEIFGRKYKKKAMAKNATPAN